MNYKEANILKEQRDKDWDDYYTQCGKPTLNEYERCVLNSPEGVFNQNLVTRCGGIMIVSENDKGVYEYPSGLMAWGYGIPDEAYLSEEDLERDNWDVSSHKETFDW